MDLCRDCSENCCDDCYEIDCQCNQSNHTAAPIVLIRDGLAAMDGNSVYINTSAITTKNKGSYMEIMVNGNVYRVTVKTIKLGPNE